MRGTNSMEINKETLLEILDEWYRQQSLGSLKGRVSEVEFRRGKVHMTIERKVEGAA